MRVYDLIRKKRDGLTLSREELEFLLRGYTEGGIPDYQMAAFCMAVYFRGLSPEETAAFTLAMARSGEELDLSSIPGIKVDKHSTGGVADTTTLVLAPLVAACGVPVVKMSGRGLGHTGGTIDKLEAIPGFRTDLSPAEVVTVAREVGVVVAGQTGHLAPADKKLYALRDVTATVDSIPLIASSVMSKKLAGGAEAILLDVKCGSGAFLKSEQEAKELAKLMVSIGQAAGRRTVAVVSDMNQPLGRAVGNALEVREAIATLRGEGPRRLEELCLLLAGEMICLGGRASSLEEGRRLAEQALRSGEGLERFRRWIKAQGGAEEVVDTPGLLPLAEVVRSVTAQREGYLASVVAEELGRAAVLLGAGRARKEDPVDSGVGLIVHAQIGERVERGAPLATLYARTEAQADEVEPLIRGAFQLSALPVLAPPLVYCILR